MTRGRADSIQQARQCQVQDSLLYPTLICLSGASKVCTPSGQDEPADCALFQANTRFCNFLKVFCVFRLYGNQSI